MKYKYFVVRLGEKARAYEEQRSALLRLCSGQWRYRERERQTDRGERERENIKLRKVYEKPKTVQGQEHRKYIYVGSLNLRGKSISSPCRPIP